MSIREKAMLIRHSVSKMDFRKYDKTVSDEVAEIHNANRRTAGRYNKRLIAKEHLKEINRYASDAYRHHLENTLPWDPADIGTRILPAANYFGYMAKQREIRGKFESTVEAFIGSYPRFVDRARSDLGTLFNENDYPDISTLRRRFGIDISVSPMPASEDFRIDLGEAEVARIRKEIEGRMQQTLADALEDLWKRLFESIAVMRDRLKEYKGEKGQRFYGAWVENVRSICELIPRLNFTGDERLEETRKEVLDKLLQQEAEVLKTVESEREEVAAAADDILAKMSGYFGQEAA